jgi:glycosyltransferase involved in cell wall biosynthesis
MSVYNGEDHLREAIESVLKQTLTDFEFVIVNDGSTDATGDIIVSFGDPRIRFIDQKSNKGVAFSASLGCRAAQGAYIARIDADDICAPDRFAREVDYLDKQPEIGVVGSWVEYIDSKGMTLSVWETPTLPGAVSWHLFFGTCIANSTSMIRRTLMDELGYYDVSLGSYSEDYDFWARASDVTRLTNIDALLVKRRVWSGSIASRAASKQEKVVREVMRSLIERQLDLTVSADDVVSLRLLATEQIAGDLNRIKQVASLLPRMHRAYVARTSLSDEEKNVVGLDAALKLYALAHEVRRLSRRASVSIALRGARLDPRPLRAHSREGLRKTIL